MSPYRYEVTRHDYRLYASGNVFASLPGHPGFPVRLASEIFQTCCSLREAAGASPERIVLYDPCCGAGYLLATTAFRHWQQLRAVVGSDLDPESLQLAEKNLALLTPAGLDSRREELQLAQTGEWRASREEALRSLEELASLQGALSQDHPMSYRLARADAGSPDEVASAVGEGLHIDVAMVDVPYEDLSEWRGSLSALGSRDLAISRLLGSLLGVLSPGAVVAVASTKKDKVAHPAYQQRRRFKLGKRKVTYLSPALPSPPAASP